MDLFLMQAEDTDISLQDMIKEDMKEEFGRSYHEDFNSDFALGLGSAFDNDMLLGGFEPLFDLNGMVAMDDIMSSTSSVSSPPAASTTSSVCSSASSMDDTDSVDQMYQGEASSPNGMPNI